MVLTGAVVPDNHHLQCSYIHGVGPQGAVLPCANGPKRKERVLFCLRILNRL